jgi:hypothetical protein
MIFSRRQRPLATPEVEVPQKLQPVVGTGGYPAVLMVRVITTGGPQRVMCQHCVVCELDRLVASPQTPSENCGVELAMVRHTGGLFQETAHLLPQRTEQLLGEDDCLPAIAQSQAEDGVKGRVNFVRILVTLDVNRDDRSADTTAHPFLGLGTVFDQPVASVAWIDIPSMCCPGSPGKNSQEDFLGIGPLLKIPDRGKLEADT